MLSFYSNFFVKFFFGSSPKNDVYVDDFDRETFQTFLDCLLGVKPYSVIDALLIYPIAHKFQVEKCLKKCVNVLKPTEMNDNVLLTLNLALFYECNVLVDDVINFLKNEVNITQLLEDNNFNQLLEPASMLKLIEHVKTDSYLWKAVYEWGENYLTKHGKTVSVAKFFDDVKILKKFGLTDFESIESIFDFHESVTKGNFLSPKKLLIQLKKKLVENNEKFPKTREFIFMFSIIFNMDAGSNKK